MDSSRRTPSRRDTSSRSSRDASNRSSRIDMTRRWSTAYTHDTAGQGGSPSGYDRTYSTHDVARQHSSTGDTERQTSDVASPSGYDRAYSTHDASQAPSNQLGSSAGTDASTSRDITPTELLLLANDARSLRTEHEILDVKTSLLLDKSLSGREVLELSRRATRLGIEALAITEEREHLQRQQKLDERTEQADYELGRLRDTLTSD